MKINQRSENNLKGVHPDLIKVVREVEKSTNLDFIITEGLRTVERQKQLVKEGKSKTMNSRHITGKAIDIVPVVSGEVSWNIKDFKSILQVFRDAAKKLGVPLEFGADWKSFVDAPHIQLPHNQYP